MKYNSYPLVSVIMITYGHEIYIKQAIESVLKQKYDGEIELIIANDASPDKTDVIVKKIIENHPRSIWIKYTCHNTNKGMMPNFIWSLSEAKGQYIALCDGDDHWTDPYKLQKQIDIIDTDLNVNLVATNAIITETNQSAAKNFLNSSDSIFKNDIVPIKFIFERRGVVLPTATFLFRKSMLDDIFFQMLDKSPVGDFVLLVRAIVDGKIYFLNKNTAVYRITHNSDSWTSSITKEYLDLYFKKRMEFWKLIEELSVNSFKPFLIKAISNQVTAFINSSSRFISIKSRLFLIIKYRKLINTRNFFYLLPRVLLKKRK